MAPDRSFYPANEARGVALVWRTHDGLNRFEQITTPASSDSITHPPTPRARYDTGISQIYRGVQRWRFAGDLRRHRLAPHEFQQHARDGRHPSFTQRPGISSTEISQTTVDASSVPSLIARLDLYSLPNIPRFNPTQGRTQKQTHRRQALPTKTIRDMIQRDGTVAFGQTETSPKVKAATKATAWVEKVRKKRRCSDLFNKNFSFSPALQPTSSQPSPRVSPRSSISSASSKPMVEEPAKRQRIDSSSSGTSDARFETTEHDGYSLACASLTTYPHGYSIRYTPSFSTPHPGHPVDFAAPNLETYEECGPVIDPQYHFDLDVHESCFESSQRRSSLSEAHLHHQIAEEHDHGEELEQVEASDEREKSIIAAWTSSVGSSNDASQKSSSASSRSSARASSTDTNDSMEAFLRHVRESFEARKRRGMDDKVFEDEVGRFCASISEPL